MGDEARLLRRVTAVFQGESNGEAMFGGLAALWQDPEQAYKLRVLHQLEVETKAKARSLVAALGGGGWVSPVLCQFKNFPVPKHVCF